MGERLFFDISFPSTLTFGGKHHWLLVINDCSNYCWSFFLHEKSDLSQTILTLINNLKIKHNLLVQCICCNNAGENQAFKQTCDKEGLGINFKYIAPGTPQQNGCVKCKFATLFNWVCTMLNGGKFTAYLQSGLWAEVANTATTLENNLITPNRTLSPFQQFFGKEKQNVLMVMQKIGEMFIATFKDNTHQAKLAKQGTLRIWVGYAENHPTSTYQIFNPKKK